MNSLNQKVLEVAQTLEQQVDDEIDRINKLEVSDIEKLRSQRIKELKAAQAKKIEHLQLGHGQYEEIPDEKSFFGITKKSTEVICHFYTPTSERCKILDMHLKKLAPKHIETKICHLNIEKCPFLADRLKVKIIPTVVMFKNQIMIDRLTGFTTLGNCDDFSTELLEWRLAQNGMLNYDGDLTTPPENQIKASKTKKIIRGQEDSDSDDDYVTHDAPNKTTNDTISMKFEDMKLLHFNQDFDSDDELNSD